MRILLATDGSPYALEAAELVRRMGLPWGTCVDLVSVAGGKRRRVWRHLFRRRERTLWEEAEGWLHRTEAVLADPALILRRELLEGPPEVVIPARAMVGSYDLVIAGARGHRSSLFSELGRVATALLRSSPAPVLLVRTRRVSGSRKDEAAGVGRLHVLPVRTSDREVLRASWQVLEFAPAARGRVEFVRPSPAQPRNPGSGGDPASESGGVDLGRCIAAGNPDLLLFAPRRVPRRRWPDDPPRRPELTGEVALRMSRNVEGSVLVFPDT